MASATLGGVYVVSSEGADMLADWAESAAVDDKFDSHRADSARLSVLSNRVKSEPRTSKTR